MFPHTKHISGVVLPSSPGALPPPLVFSQCSTSTTGIKVELNRLVLFKCVVCVTSVFIGDSLLNVNTVDYSKHQNTSFVYSVQPKYLCST